MNPNPHKQAAEPTVFNALTLAATCTLLLVDHGVQVIAALANGRRPVLMVDRLPPGLQGVAKRSHGNGCGGTTVITAAEFHGCQLEWMHDVPAARPQLKAVPNG